MQSQRWNRIGELFAAARVLNPAQRVVFLDENCNHDPDLAREVNVLLRADDESGVLDHPILSSKFVVPRVVAGRFQIVGALGEGGMGVVYEALDLRLGDRVALKTIRSEIATDSNVLDRFKREVLLGKRVTHPNVCRIFDLGLDRLDNGQEFLFLTMQFLSGETLSSRIKRGRLIESEASSLLEGMMGALSAAHKVGVIHRDFKSGNVMLVNNENQLSAVVTDFGLARCIHDEITLTMGNIVGTVDYMAPEQIRGAEVSPATDIYSLGVVMYEMVTGTRPFIGDSQIAVALQHLNTEPIPPKQIVPQLNDVWDDAIMTCLRKVPSERFASVEQVRAALIGTPVIPKHTTKRKSIDLRLLSGLMAILVMTLILGISRRAILHHKSEPFSAQDRSLAVLPFRELGQTPEHLSYGFTEEVMNALGKIEGLRVVGPESSFRFKATELSSIDIGKKLGAHYLLYGSVNHVDNQFHVVFRIVDSKDGSQVWSDEISRNESETLLLSGEIARSLSSELGLGMIDTDRSERLADVNGLTVRDLYWTGRFLFHQRSDASVQKSLEYFRHAVVGDPSFAEGYCGIADALFVLSERGLVSPKDMLPEARNAAQRAVALNKTSPAAYVSLAQITSVYDRNFEEAERLFRVALRLDPRHALAWQWLAYQLIKERRFSEAVNAAQKAVESDPLSTAANINYLVVLYYAGLDDAAMQQSRKLAQIDSKSSLPNLITAEIFARRGLTSEAIHELQALSFEQQQNRVALRVAVEVYAKAGEQQSAERALSQLLGRSEGGGIPPSYLAIAYAALGNKDEAFLWLNRACDSLDPFASIANVYPAFDEMRSDSRWLPLMNRLGIREKIRSDSSALVTSDFLTMRASSERHTSDPPLDDVEVSVSPAQKSVRPEAQVLGVSNQYVAHQAVIGSTVEAGKGVRDVPFRYRCISSGSFVLEGEDVRNPRCEHSLANTIHA